MWNGGRWCGFLWLFHPSFIHCLVIKNALITREKMCKWGYTGDSISLCLFCRGRIESRDYVFFWCSFSRRVLSEMIKSCMVLNPCVEWKEVIQWSIDNLQSKNIKTSLYKLSFWACVYHLWKQRNDLLCGNTPKTKEDMVDSVRWEIRARIMVKWTFKLSTENLELGTDSCMDFA